MASIKSGGTTIPKKQKLKMVRTSATYIYYFLCFMACWCVVSSSSDDRATTTSSSNGNGVFLGLHENYGRVTNRSNSTSSQTGWPDSNSKSIEEKEQNDNFVGSIGLHHEDGSNVLPFVLTPLLSVPSHRNSSNITTPSPLPSPTKAPSTPSPTAPPSPSPTSKPSSSPTSAPSASPTSPPSVSPTSPPALPSIPAPHSILMYVATWIFFIGLLIFGGYECYIHRSTIFFITARLCDEMLFRIRSFCNKILGRSASSSSPNDEHRQPATLNEILFEEDSQSLNQAELSERLLV